MSIKIKALGLCLFAALAVSAFAVVNATAQTGGHFVSDEAHTTIIGEESGVQHQLHFKRTGAGAAERIGCTSDSYTGTTTNATEAEIKIVPSWGTCHTTVENPTHFDVHENGCYLLFRKGTTVSHDTVRFECPNQDLEITHPNCNITVPSQTVGGSVVVHNNSSANGVVYTTDTTSDSKHSITIDVTVQGITSHYHSFGCQFIFGTVNSSEMNGSVTVRGTNTLGNNVNITAT